MRIGRYEVERELGTGGMGSVYRARDPQLARSVAIKLLHGGSSSASSLRREARALAALSHPGIVTVHEIGEDDGRAFLVMELLDGRSLRDVVAGGQLERARALEIVTHVARALGVAHARGVLHRDIKPENVMLQADGSIKVVDFGLACRLDDDATITPDPGGSRVEMLASVFAQTLRMHGSGGQSTLATERGPEVTGSIFGTPGYMAPEVLAGEPSSEASDVYSLGIMLYELIAGRRPYEAPNFVALISQVLEGTPPAPLEDRLAPLVERMIARDPALRPSADEVVAALETDEPRRSQRSSRPLVLAALATATLVMVAFLVMLRSRNPAERELPKFEIDVGDVELRFSTYGPGQPIGIPIALALALDSFEGVHAAQASAPRATTGLGEVDAITHAVVRGRIVERDRIARAELELVVGQRVIPITIDHPGREIGELVLAIAKQVVKTLRGRDAEPLREVLERKLTDAGEAAVRDHVWDSGRVLFETLVVVAPDSATAWARLATLRGWSRADQTLIEHAATRAAELAVPGSRTRQLWKAVLAFHRYEFAEAIAGLTPLVPDELPRNPSIEELDATYFLGEAYWHDGNYAAGAALLDRARVGSLQTISGVHLLQYSFARRDIVRGALLVGQQKHSEMALEFVAGNYRKLAEGPDCPEKFYARLVLDLPADIAMYARVSGNTRAVGTFNVAMALAAGDETATRAAIASVWPAVIEDRASDATLYQLRDLGELIAGSGLPEETARLIEYAKQCVAPPCIEQRAVWSAIAAPLVGVERAGLAPTDGLSTRARQRVRAALAELSGDRRGAVAAYRTLVDNPGDRWDYPDRVALLRNLRALGERTEIEHRCRDLTHPPIFGFGWLIARRACAGME